MSKIGIIGAGAWGTSLATVMRRAGNEVVLQAHEPETAAAINKSHTNPDFLPGVELDPENGVLVKVNFEQNAYDVQINYNIIGMNLPTVELEFSITEPSRY